MNVKHVDSPTPRQHVFAWRNQNESRTIRVQVGHDDIVVKAWTANGWTWLVDYPTPSQVKEDLSRQRVMSKDEKSLAHRRNLAVSTALAQRAMSTHFDHEVYAA